MILRLDLPPANSRPFDFVAIGECSLDLLCVVSEFPGPDHKADILKRMELPGGQAATAAVACARLGWRSRYVGVFGSDEAGRTVRDALVREGVDVAGAVASEAATRSAVVLVEETTGRRIVFGSRDPRLNAASRGIGEDVFSSGRLVLIDGSDSALASRAARTAREAGARTLVDLDVVSPDALDLLRLIDVAILPASFVRQATGVGRLRDAVGALARTSGAGAVVATDGPAGCVAWCAGEAVEIPGERVAAIDTTGAGDAFRGGFAAAWLDTAPRPPDLIEALRFAGRVAARSCLAYGAQTGLPRLGELPYNLAGRCN